MKTHTTNPTSAAGAAHTDRQPAGAGGVSAIQLFSAPEPAFVDNRAASLTLQRDQQLANNSPQALQLKQRAEVMSAASAASMHCRQLPVQRQVREPVPRVDEDELLQGKFEPAPASVAATAAPVQREKKPNATGLPDQLKSGIEALSGMSMDQVKVHYNSEKPAQLQAHAYAQGSEIHVGPGQEQHLPHEAWHVVQQAQGRVKPTLQMMNSVSVNDDAGLEKEADLMGEQALDKALPLQRASANGLSTYGPIQRFSDSVNDTRRDKASESSGEDMQLDHGIAQDTLKKFYDTLPVVYSMSAELRPPNALKFRDKYVELFNKQDISLDGNPFLNLRNNITPGFKNTVNNPGSRFDPQVETRGKDVVVSVQSRHLETLDRHMRSISRKIDTIRSMNELEPDSTDEFRKELNQEFKLLIDALDFLGTAGTIPAYAKDDWYDYKDKKVKKVSATYLDESDGLLDLLGLKKARRYSPKSILRFVSINMHEQIAGRKRRKGTLSTEALPLTVTITVPEETWQHIYARHTIDYFAWDVQAINTFWKDDPQQIFSEFEDAISAELLLIIDRQIDLEHEVSQIKQGNGSDIESEKQINEAGTRFFFQGTYVFEEESTGDGPIFEKDELKIVLKSFAPQSSDFAYAILPAELIKRKPAEVQEEDL